jgi:Short C-terminal domain
MLFLYRPRQTYMPFRRPRQRMDQDRYNMHMQQAFSATQQVPQYAPVDAPPADAVTDDPIARLKDLAALHESGALSDEEFAAAKARLLGLDETTP